MTSNTALADHQHNFLGAGHAENERRTWAVIYLCGLMMIAEILGGYFFGSIALVGDGLHMSTHAGALLLAAIAYKMAWKHLDNPKFSFGTGKVGDLAGFTSAIVLAMIALLIGYEAILRFFHPVPIRFSEAIPIACIGLAVNVASVFLLGLGHDHDHGHGHSHGHSHDPCDHAGGHGEGFRIATRSAGVLLLEIFEEGVPPRFRIRSSDRALRAEEVEVTTVREDGLRQRFEFVSRGEFLESVDEIPEPHAFEAAVSVGAERHVVMFEEHQHGDAKSHRDNNMRAALIHIMADAAVSVCVIVGLLLAWAFGWLFMDPLAGLLGFVVISAWAYALMRDTGAVLLDANPDGDTERKIRDVFESEGDEIRDFHLWRLGPGHLGMIVSVKSLRGFGPEDYRAKLSRFPSLSHVTVEVV